MDHSDHVNLLRSANLKKDGVYADFGAGSGAFTLALRELTGAEARIFAVDKDARALDDLQKAMLARFGSIYNLFLIPMDFSQPLFITPLDGIVMANSLHFSKEKEKALQHIRTFLKPGGALILVEYNVDKGNMWVPYPLSFEAWCELAPRVGFEEPRLLARVPSRFLKEFYSAVTYKSSTE